MFLEELPFRESFALFALLTLLLLLLLLLPTKILLLDFLILSPSFPSLYGILLVRRMMLVYDDLAASSDDDDSWVADEATKWGE